MYDGAYIGSETGGWEFPYILSIATKLDPPAMLMENSNSTSEAVKAVNDLGCYCSEDQEAVLQVIEDYFDHDLSRHYCDSKK